MRIILPLVAALLAGMLAVSPAAADVFYRLGMDGARIAGDRLQEGSESFVLRREGGALPPAVLADPGRGSDVLRFRSGATPPGARADRSELRLSGSIDYGRAWFLGMSVSVPRGVVRSSGWHLFMQCHQNGTATTPPISFNLDPDGTMSLVARGDEDSFRRLWSGPLRPGRWYRLVLEFRMGSNGLARLWVNGRKVSDRALPLRWIEGQDQCTLKVGLYRGPAATPFEMRFDDIVLGTSYAEVAGR